MTTPIRGKVWRQLIDVRGYGDPGPVLIPGGWLWEVPTPKGPYRDIGPSHADAIRDCTATVRLLRQPPAPCPF